MINMINFKAKIYPRPWTSDQKKAFGVRGREVGADILQLYPVLLLANSFQ